VVEDEVSREASREQCALTSGKGPSSLLLFSISSFNSLKPHISSGMGPDN
jgi:hypothetical protein